jgi:hypothetical protein
VLRPVPTSTSSLGLVQKDSLLLLMIQSTIIGTVIFLMTNVFKNHFETKTVQYISRFFWKNDIAGRNYNLIIIDKHK